MASDDANNGACINDIYYSGAKFSLLAPLAVLYSVVSNCLGGILRFLPPERMLPPPNALLTKQTQQQLAIVTGSNTGVGYETAKSLACDYGYTVILGCRNTGKGTDAAKRIQQHFDDKQTGNYRSDSKIVAKCVHLDLSDMKTIDTFVATVKNEYNLVDQIAGDEKEQRDSELVLLVNNAGRNSFGDTSIDGFDDLFQCNFLGHYYLTNKLIPYFSRNKSSVPPRVINVSSVMHHFVGRQNKSSVFDMTSSNAWLDKIRHGYGSDTYSLTKLAAILFTKQLNDRKIVKSYAVNPGAVNSDIWRNFPSFLKPIFGLIYLTTSQGCRTTVAACVCSENELTMDRQRSDESLSSGCYLQPYGRPHWLNTSIFPIWEMLGRYAGYVVTIPRLPQPPMLCEQIQTALWDACAKATNVSNKWPITDISTN